jgi:kynurenine formamidase
LKEKLILLSYILSEDTPLYGDTPKLEIQHDKCIAERDTCNTAMVKLHAHSGTHIDAPKHFWDEGRNISDYSIHELTFQSPFLIECPKSSGELIVPRDLEDYDENLKKCDILLFRTGFWKLREKDEYRLDNPGISPEVANLIREKYENISCIGLDSISVSSYSNRELGRKTHQIFLQKGDFQSEPILLIEDMDLSSIRLNQISTILVSPLMIEDIDSSPCNVIGIMDLD